MRQILDDLLCRRYPALYADRHGDARTTAMCWGFEVGDGWFAILDALSTVLTRHAMQDGRPPPPVQQVKAKFGTLRYAMASDATDCGAVAMATEMSGRICEVTGRPGRPMRQGRLRLTRAPDVEPGAQWVAASEADAGRPPVPPLGFGAANLLRRQADRLAEPPDVPVGWLDLVDGMLRQVSPVAQGHPATSVRIGRVRATADGLLVDGVPADPRAEGVIALAVALAPRLDPTTGAAGPVTDAGIPITARPRA